VKVVSEALIHCSTAFTRTVYHGVGGIVEHAVRSDAHARHPGQLTVDDLVEERGAGAELQ
jgi:hypothetical protein